MNIDFFTYKIFKIFNQVHLTCPHCFYMTKTLSCMLDKHLFTIFISHFLHIPLLPSYPFEHYFVKCYRLSKLILLFLKH